MIEQAITVTAGEITILGQFFIHKDFSLTRKEVLLDVLGQYYNGHTIRVRLLDGENSNFSGFVELLTLVADRFNIPGERIVIESHNPNETMRFKHELLRLGIFISVNDYLPEIDRNLDNARFVGCLLGRYNINRVRVAYELDQEFTNDTYITFQPKVEFVHRDLMHFGELYTKELAWLQTKQFDHDLTSRHQMGMIGWYDSCRNYNNVWNRYQIEVVSETDSMSDFWFTEKTANCLATGKPFVLVAGTGSLARLQDMGFQTFSKVLDESYDLAKHPYDRIKRLTNSLRVLYNSPSKVQQLAMLYQIANQNIELYGKYIKSGKKN
jgi:hypothetical protein